MSERKKILHLITGLELGGGAENMLFQLLPKMQDELDNRVCVVRGEGEIGKKLEGFGVPVYYLQLKNLFDLGVIFRYRKILREFGPDVQVNYLIHADIFGRIFGKIFGVKKIVPYIRNIHRNRKCLMFLDRITLPLADFVLTNSETAKRYYIEKMGAKVDKIICIPNGVDLSRFENLNVNIAEKKKEIGIPENAFVIGTVARLEKQKDIPTLIRAFEMVQKKHSETHLLIVGHGSQKNEMVELIKRSGIIEEVTLLEKRTDILELLQIMDVFVLPSLSEGMSNALLEAMASRKVVVVSGIEENMELIKHDLNGLNFKTGNANDLGDILLGCIDKNGDIKRYQDNAFFDIQKKYNIEMAGKSYEKFLINF